MNLDELDPKQANVLYHDAAAKAYDTKWAISFEPRSTRYVRERADRMLPGQRYGRVLEVGCGTGFLILNLWLAGYVKDPYACDISAGMLEVCAESARRLGCDLNLRVADAERLPYDDGQFDLVTAHAVLHHLPEPEAALREIHRVLRPGGAVWILGEPSRLGDRMARVAGRMTSRAMRTAARFIPSIRKPVVESDGEEARILRELEWSVDLHTFVPSEAAAMAERAGFRHVRVETEELLSSLVGWTVRTLEAEVPSGLLGRRWARAAYRAWEGLSAIDRGLYRWLPKDLFYNVLLYGEKGE
ncbi:MAG TPA: methyltransferase domain-containing protein [Actinomycetota bacterium]|nr:methyltransferase domain-containing protein [Actinomycetota bacterium]